MKPLFRLIALALAVATLAAWLLLGANRGWTRTSVPERIVDQVTGLESFEYRKKFVPGVDFLAAGLTGALALAGLSFLFNKQQNTQS
jgi:hypothetical protein